MPDQVGVGEAAAGSPAGDRDQAIANLEAQLAATPRRARPREHGVVAYRLGLAYAESPRGDPGANQRRALGCFEVAAEVFGPQSSPVEHARALNAAGASHRALGNRKRAAELFAQAVSFFSHEGTSGRTRDEERAAALNNLGLVRTELGELPGAVDAFDRAAQLFGKGSPDGRRGRVAALHNRGLAHAAGGTVQALQAAVADYDNALAGLDRNEAPYHHGLVHHSRGVAYSALAALVPAEAKCHLGEAVSDFDEALAVFTRGAFPYQHALAKHNQGRAWAALGASDDNLRRALACFEDALAILDPRLHGEAWRHAYAGLSEAEERLSSSAPGQTRAGHFATLVAGVGDDERARLLEERLIRLLALPTPLRHQALAELAQATLTCGQPLAGRIVEAELQILMVLPNEGLEAFLRAQMDVHGHLSGQAREDADRVLDGAVGHAIEGPQRIFVRDFLYSLGFERP